MAGRRLMGGSRHARGAQVGPPAKSIGVASRPGWLVRRRPRPSSATLKTPPYGSGSSASGVAITGAGAATPRRPPRSRTTAGPSGRASGRRGSALGAASTTTSRAPAPRPRSSIAGRALAAVRPCIGPWSRGAQGGEPVGGMRAARWLVSGSRRSCVDVVSRSGVMARAGPSGPSRRVAGEDGSSRVLVFAVHGWLAPLITRSTRSSPGDLSRRRCASSCCGTPRSNVVPGCSHSPSSLAQGLAVGRAHRSSDCAFVVFCRSQAACGVHHNFAKYRAWRVDGVVHDGDFCIARVALGWLVWQNHRVGRYCLRRPEVAKTSGFVLAVFTSAWRGGASRRRGVKLRFS